MSKSTLRGVLFAAWAMATAVAATREAWAYHHPSVDRLFPRRGPPGTIVTLVGHDFVAGVGVYFISLEHALPIVRRTLTRLTVRIPEGISLGTFSVMVTIGDDEESAGTFEVTPASERPH